MENLQALVPAYAKDLRLNLGGLTSIETLTSEELWGTVLATAYASRNATVLREAAALANEHLTPESATAAKTAAALMGMNNIYYRFVHLASNELYGKLPARLRMQGLKTHGVEPKTFELWALAVSAVNGCGLCIDSHERVLSQAGVRPEAIQDAIRIASVVHALAGVVTAEQALADDPAAA